MKSPVIKDDPTFIKEVLLYVGNSNKRFTYNKIYFWTGGPYYDSHLNLSVIANGGQIIYFNNNYFNYFFENFKFISETEYNQYIRKNKLKKISSTFHK